MAQFALFHKNIKEAERGLNRTTGLLSSSALQRCLQRLKRGTPGREKRFSLETSTDNYETGLVHFRAQCAWSDFRAEFLAPDRVRIRIMSPLDAPRSPVAAVRDNFLAKVDEDVWSAHQRGSGALVSWSRCTERVFSGLFIAPPSPTLQVITTQLCPSSLRTSTALLITLPSSS